MFCCLYYYFLDYSVLYVCIFGVRGGMHDTELLGEKRLFGAWSVQQGQGRRAFHQFTQILGKVYFESPN